MFPDTQAIVKPTFKWYHASGAQSYRIEIDTDGTFFNPYLALPLTDTSYTSSVALPYGRTVWRVSSSVNTDRYSIADTFWIKNINGIVWSTPRSVLRNDIVHIKSYGRVIAINYSVKNYSNIMLKIVTLNGKCVASLQSGRKSPGTYQLTWNPNGSIPSGTYLVCATIDNNNYAERIIVTQ
jgi:hypothetical protein